MLGHEFPYIGEPQYRPTNIIIFIIRTPPQWYPNFGNSLSLAEGRPTPHQRQPEPLTSTRGSGVQEGLLPEQLSQLFFDSGKLRDKCRLQQLEQASFVGLWLLHTRSLTSSQASHLPRLPFHFPRQAHNLKAIPLADGSDLLRGQSSRGSP